MIAEERPAWAIRIRNERKARGWPAVEMARRLRDAADQRIRDELPSLDNLVSYVRRWESGKVGVTERYRLLYARAFDSSEDELFSAHERPAIAAERCHDDVRQALHRTLTTGAMAEATMDDWDATAQRYGAVARSRPAAALLGDLATDLDDLWRAMEWHTSASALRRLTSVAAQMSGLMCLMLVKLDDRQGFRRWARTARAAAYEAGDPATRSWVLAQEAYGHYYAGDLDGAVNLAQGAQHVAGPCVGAVLAAALEARAHAAFGPERAGHSYAALRRAEGMLGALRPEEVNTSAFGYNEAQLRFHEGSALTHLGDTAAAWHAQQRAMQLCPPEDYLDRSLTRLDRTICLLRDGDMSGALDYAIATLDPLTEQQRQGIVALKGRAVLEQLSPQQQSLPAAQQLHELLTPTRPALKRGST